MILLLGTVFGYFVARRLFAEACPWLACSLAPLLGLFCALLCGGILLPYLSWSAWRVSMGALFLTGCFALRRQSEPTSFRSPKPLLLLYLVPALVVILVFCWFHQSVGMVVDGDFFVHAANIGLFARGYLPPVNPFLGIPMHGHYGRDLAIAIFFKDTGLGLLTSEWVLTTLWQTLSFLVLFFWLRREFDSDLAGILGSAFAFFGMNFSAYAGLAELLANNNPIAFCLMITISWAVFRAKDLGPGAWLGAALLLGLDAIIYETHFGVLWLSLLLLSRRPKAAAGIATIALVCALMLSGVVRSTARGAPESGAAQTIRMRIFKKELLSLRSDNLRPSRAFETKARPWAADFTPGSDYHRIWSHAILDTFWYPVWLLPFCTVFLALGAWRGRCSEAGLWWASVAWLSLMTPALIDFGVFEAETARWLVVTALGSSIALGLSLALLCQARPNLGRPLALILIAMCGFGLKISTEDMIAAYRHPGQPLPVGRPGLPPGNGLLPNPALALEYHYQISGDVLEAAQWIREHSLPGQRFICDSWGLPTNARGALVGAVGLLPAMEARPPVWSRSIDSYQANLQQRGFWATGDLDRLAPDVDWLLVSHSSENFGEPVYENAHARVYRAPSPLETRPATGGAFDLEFERNGFVGSLFKVHFEGPPAHRFELRFAPLAGQEFVADENLQSGLSRADMMFVAPYATGEYQVQARLAYDGPWRDFGTFTARPTVPESVSPSEAPQPAR